MSEQQTQNTPPLVALVYRAGKGCRQYAFGTVLDLAKWAARHPYKNETLRVMPFSARRKLADLWMPAAEAAQFVKDAIDTDASVAAAA